MQRAEVQPGPDFDSQRDQQEGYLALMEFLALLVLHLVAVIPVPSAHLQEVSVHLPCQAFVCLAT